MCVCVCVCERLYICTYMYKCECQCVNMHAQILHFGSKQVCQEVKLSP